MNMIMLKISIVIFVAGNLLEMGLKLDPQDAIRGLRNVRFLIHTLVWGFIVGPMLAYGITCLIPMEEPYKIGLILIGMTPCAPFLPMLANKAKGDLGATAALMLLTAVVTIIFVPLAVPLMAKGLTVSAWTIAQPLLIFVLLPLVVGMVTRRASLVVTRRMQPFVKRTTGIFTIVVVVLCGIVYGKGLLGLPGSLAIVSQVIFFFIMATVTYWFGFGLKHEEKIVLSLGMTTRNLGAAVAPLFSIANIDERAIIMVVLGIPLMVVSSVLSTIFFRTKG